MEKQTNNIMPELHLFPRLDKVVDFGKRVLSHCNIQPTHTFATHGDHDGHHGAERMLSSTLEDSRDDVYHELGHMLINGNLDSQTTYKQLQMEFRDGTSNQ